MPIREIVWNVDPSLCSISPNTPQDGGVQGEHNATKAVFHIPAGSELESEKYQLYIYHVNATGSYDKTEPLTIENGQVSCLLPRQWTQYGGMSRVSLAAEADGETVYMLEGKVTFHSRQTATAEEKRLLEGFMQEMCDAAANSAEAAAAAAKNAAYSDEDARRAANAAEIAAERAEEAAEHIHAGGTGGGESSGAAVLYTPQTLTEEQKAQARANIGAIAHALQPIIDAELDATSGNPVANKAVTAAVQKLTDLIDGLKQNGGGGAGLPDASEAFANNCPLVVKDGKWVIADAPMVTKADTFSMQTNLDVLNERVAQLQADAGDIDSALDGIIALQEELITGGTELTMAEEAGF